MRNYIYPLFIFAITSFFNFDSFGQNKYDYTVPNVKLVKQPTSNVCWAAALTMMYNWKDGNEYTIGARIKSIPNNTFNRLYTQNLGLGQDDQGLLIKLTGLQFDYPQSYTAEKLIDLLKTYGPLMVFWDETEKGSLLMHAVVIYGIRSNDGVSGYFIIMNPARETSWIVTYREFIAKLEAEVKYNPDYKNGIQVMYWPKKEEGDQSTEESYE